MTTSSICAMTGNPIVEPVVSRVTGHLYEKAAIEKHLSSFPYCPVTNKPMSHDDIVTIPTTQKQQPQPQSQSPVTYLQKLQEEYNILVIESFHLRKHLKGVKEELTNSLYMNEAANLTIEKVIKEKEEAEREKDKLAKRLKQLQK